jgi:FkbM family methyltransferase
MLKALARKALATLGLEARRLPRPPAPASASGQSGSLRFGVYTIVTDNAELVRSYHNYPETNAVIGRLVSLLARHQPIAMIDIGANCGDSLAIAKQASPAVEVLCIEGDGHLCSTLRSNATQFSDVTIKNCYLGEKATQIVVSVYKRGQNNTLVHNKPNNGHTEIVAIEALDDVVLSWRGLPRLRFIKCDTEGYDVRVLLGGLSTLRSHQPVLLFEYNREAMRASGETGLRIFSALVEAQYLHGGFYDAFGRFILEGDLTDQRLIEDLHAYADGQHGKVLYYDIVTFARKDRALAAEFFTEERRRLDERGYISALNSFDMKNRQKS